MTPRVAVAPDAALEAEPGLADVGAAEYRAQVRIGD
jgi:hypothetical protein